MLDLIIKNGQCYIDGELNDETFGPDEDYDHTSSGNTIRINNHSPFAGDHMLDCSYAGLAITNGMKYIGSHKLKVFGQWLDGYYQSSSDDDFQLLFWGLEEKIEIYKRK